MLRFVAAIGLVVTSGVAVLVWQRQAAPLITREIAWAGAGVWPKAETHDHTHCSDGHTVDEVLGNPARQFYTTPIFFR